MDFHLDTYLKSIQQKTEQQLSFHNINTKEELLLRQVVGRDRLRSLLKIAEIPQKLPVLGVKQLESERLFHDCTLQRVALTVCKDLSFPMYLLSPKDERQSDYRPCAIFCHGHGNGSRETLGLDTQGNSFKEENYHHLAPIELCKLGYTVAIPEILGFGDTCTTWDATCRAPYGFLSMMGLSLAGLRVYQIMRVIDYLILFFHADIENLVCMGISGGGMLTAFAAACDTRIRCAVISGYLSSFSESILSLEHCICNFVPEMYHFFEMKDIAAMILPRTLLIEAGTKDPIFPIQAVRNTCRELRRLYTLIGKPENFLFEEFHGGHQISGKLAYPTLKSRLEKA